MDLLSSFFFSLFFLAAAELLSSSLSSTQISSWFLLHSIVNFFISYLTFENVLSSPGHALRGEGICFGPSDKLPITLAVLLHAWHVLFFDLTGEDRLHHFLFIPLIGVPGALYDWGICGNVQLFFLCGLPGGLIYLLLHLRKEGELRWVNEPLFSALVNLFLRLPGGILAWYLLAFTSFYHLDRVQVPLFPLLLQLVLSPSNTLYYSFQSCLRFLSRSVLLKKDS